MSKLGDDWRRIMAKLVDLHGEIAACAGAADSDVLLRAAEEVLEELMVGRAPNAGMVARLKSAVERAKGGA